MVYVRDVFRYHHGDEGLASYGRCIGILPYEAHVLVQDLELQEILHVGYVELDLGVEVGAPVRAGVRVILCKGLVQLFEDGLDVAVVGLHYCCVQLTLVREKMEVYL